MIINFSHRLRRNSALFRPLHALVCGAACVFLASQAHAATVPSNADPARQEYTRPPAASPRALQPEVRVESAAPALDPHLAAQEFVLHTVTFSGAQAIAHDALIAPFSDALGKRITVASLFERMAKVQQLYLDHGYTLSSVSIPQQDIASGNVVIRVLEGFVSDVDIAEEFAHSPLAQDVAAEIARMRPLDMRRLERLMLILSSRLGREATAVLSAPEASAGAVPGAVSMLMTPRGPVDLDRAFVSVDNQGSRFLGPWRASAGYRRGAVCGSDADIGVAVTGSLPLDELKQVVIDGSAPVWGASGATTDLSFGQTISRPGATLDPLDVKGISRFAHAGISYPVILQRDRDLKVSAAFDYKNVATDLLGSAVFDDRLRTVSLSAHYTGADRFMGTTEMTVGYTKGFDILGGRPAGSTDLSRADGRPDFDKATATLSRVQALPQGFEVSVTAEGQYAWDPLLSSEEFGYGGQHIGRGYDASALVGDHGLSGAVEVRKSLVMTEQALMVQPYAFYDIGKVWNIDPSAKDSASGASAGFGVRVSHASGLDVDFSLAAPLTREAEDAPGYASDGGVRTYVQTRFSF